MAIKLFVDDVRDPPDDTWMVFRPSDLAAFFHLSKHANVISLDHDLGDGEMTGTEIVNTLERLVRHQFWWRTTMPEILIHSANPVGAQNMKSGIEAIRNFLQSEES